MAIMTSSAGALATDVNAASYNYSYATAKASEAKSSTKKRTGKELTYEQAYNRLKDLEFVTNPVPLETTTPAETETKPTTNTKPSQNNTSTKPTQSTSSNEAVYMTDYKGNVIATSSLVHRSYLTKTQQYLYDTIRTALAKGEKSVTFNNYYSRIDACIAYNAVTDDNPYIVWVRNYSYGIQSSKGVKSLNFINDSALVKDRAATVQLMDDYLKPMLDKASKMSTDIDKVKFVHDWIIYNVNDGSANSSDMYYNEAYSAIVDKEGVCASYTGAFTYCMQKLGIPCTMLAGTTWNGEAHCWNLVKVGGEWYECDIYWDDVITKSETDYTYTCFMQTTASLKAYDTYNGKSRTRYSGCNMLPIAKGTKYSPDNYRYSNGSNFKDLAKVVITKRTNTSTVRGYAASSGYTGYNTTITSKTTTTKSSLPSGWYKYKAVTIPGKETLSKSDWTKDGKFYYIEKGDDYYYVYDTAYDNYYWVKSDLSVIRWYMYSKKNPNTGVWTPLK